ncbi:MAG: hypothetical protein RLZZ241_1185 [Bacteroidota bacterium]|jgi:hypothetical protein
MEFQNRDLGAFAGINLQKVNPFIRGSTRKFDEMHTSQFTKHQSARVINHADTRSYRQTTTFKNRFVILFEVFVFGLK